MSTIKADEALRTYGSPLVVRNTSFPERPDMNFIITSGAGSCTATWHWQTPRPGKESWGNEPQSLDANLIPVNLVLD